MRKLYHIFKNIDKLINVLSKCEYYTLSIESTENVLTNNYLECIKKNDSTNITNIEQYFNESIYVIPIYCTQGEDTTRAKFLTVVASFYTTPFLLDNHELIIPIQKNNIYNFFQYIDDFNKYFEKKFNSSLILKKYTKDIIPHIENRIKSARKYYIEDHGQWIANFIDNLQDDISIYSFLTFIKQRIQSHVIKGDLVCYPILPPAKSKEWRSQRESAEYNFPVLEGCRDDLLQYFYRETFIYEQYGIEGYVEAQEGNIVIDAGAFIGDTACYFSRKIGATGKVFAFEIVPETVEFGRLNMKNNDCNNVEFIQKALSDRSKTFSIIRNPFSDSSACLGQKEDYTTLTVDAVTLDDFCSSRNIRVDFIKADVEGSEMSLLRGGAEVIARDAPTCAIALYHKQNDFWEIPSYLQSLRPDYQFWFRCEAEPVLFAKCSK